MLVKALYLAAAHLTARALAFDQPLAGIYAHRSLATGELQWARSDIDLVALLGEQGLNGTQLARLYQRFGLLRRLNPALHHLEIYRPSDLSRFARQDTVWNDMEQRSQLALCGQLPPPLAVPLQPLHALRRFLLWSETLFSQALQKQDQRNIEKLSLECWNFYRVASGGLQRPWLLRSQMRRDLQNHRPDGKAGARLVWEIADTLHKQHLNPLLPLKQTYRTRLVFAPFGFHRDLIVLPNASWPVPSGLNPGTMVTTPPLLHLYLQFRNSFLAWTLPRELQNLGMQAPDESAFRRDLIYYNAAHFLYFPGFSDRNSPDPEVRLSYLEWASQNDTRPPAIKAALALGSVSAYYQRAYDRLAERSCILQERLDRS